MTLEFYAAATAAILYHDDDDFASIVLKLSKHDLSFYVEVRDSKKKVKNKKKKKKKKCSSYTMLFKLSLHKTHVCDVFLGLDREQKEL
jgi:regulator of replication initiation timing